MTCNSYITIENVLNQALARILQLLTTTGKVENTPRGEAGMPRHVRLFRRFRPGLVVQGRFKCNRSRVVVAHHDREK